MSDPEKNILDELVEWRKTEDAIERVKDSPQYKEKDENAPHGYFAGRRIIGRDTPINKGISIGDSSREMIVVDDEKFPKLKKIYGDLFEKRKQELIGNREREKTGTAEILDTVYRHVLDVMPYSTEIAEEIRKQVIDRKISLTVFVDKKGGQCRHQVLLAGYLIEKMISEGLLDGKVAVNRNFIKIIGGHTWVKFTDENKQVYIVDPAQKFCGTLEEAKKIVPWFYEEPKKK